MLSVIIPANNEEMWIRDCLEALLGQKPERLAEIEIIIAANGCTDATVSIARGFEVLARARGWRLVVLDISEGSKPGALDAGDAAALGDLRLYLDADVVCSPTMLASLREALDRPGAIYASGRLVVAPARSWVTRRFADLWRRLPFMTTGVQGAGLYAVNAAGRARWGTFPRIISDDGYVRLLFRPEERVKVEVPYIWPMIEGFSGLVRVRRRQDAGMRELAEKYPGLLRNESKPPLRPADHLRLFVAAPISYLVYAGVLMVVRLSRSRHGLSWIRGR